jgi:hypothetical protein
MLNPRWPGVVMSDRGLLVARPFQIRRRVSRRIDTVIRGSVCGVLVMNYLSRCTIYPHGYHACAKTHRRIGAIELKHLVPQEIEQFVLTNLG